jgi:uncharacterized protein (TIGR00288 family)
MKIHKIAVFFDAENISYKKANIVLNTLKNKGTILIKRAYADWSSPRMKKWKEKLIELNIDAVNYHPIIKKNGSDIALAIDAAELLYTSCDFDVFALASGDSDYSPLVERMNATEKTTIGFSHKNSTIKYKKIFNEYYVLEDSFIKKHTDLTSKSQTLTPQTLGIISVISDAISSLDCKSTGFANIDLIETHIHKKYNINTFDYHSNIINFLLDYPDRFKLSNDLSECSCIPNSKISIINKMLQ